MGVESGRTGAAAARWLGVLACLLVLFGAACSSGKSQRRTMKGRHEVPLTEEELRVQLDGFTDYFSATVQNVAGIIAAETDDPAMRRVSVMWKLRAVQACRNAVLLPNAREGLVNVWTLCYQMHDFHSGPAGQERFEQYAPMATEAAGLMIERVEQIADLVLLDDQFFEAQEDVQEFAKSHPIGVELARAVTLPSDASDADTRELHWLLSVPLAPFSAFGGLDRGAEAIHEMSRVVDRVSRRAEGMPQTALWEMELLAIDAAQSPSARRAADRIDTLNASIAEMSEASTSFAKTAETLPADVRIEVETAVKNLEAQHEDVRVTLESARAALKDVRGALDDAKIVVKDAEAMTGPVERTSEHLAEAGTAWEGTVKAYRELVKDLAEDETEPDPDERPFDVREYRDAAKSIGDAAVELRSAIQELRGLVGEDLQADTTSSLEAAVERTVDHAVDSADVLSERAFRRGMILLVTGFLLAVAFVWIALKMKGSRAVA